MSGSIMRANAKEKFEIGLKPRATARAGASSSLDWVTVLEQQVRELRARLDEVCDSIAQTEAFSGSASLTGPHAAGGVIVPANTKPAGRGVSAR